LGKEDVLVMHLEDYVSVARCGMSVVSGIWSE